MDDSQSQLPSPCHVTGFRGGRGEKGSSYFWGVVPTQQLQPEMLLLKAKTSWVSHKMPGVICRLLDRNWLTFLKEQRNSCSASSPPENLAETQLSLLRQKCRGPLLRIQLCTVGEKGNSTQWIGSLRKWKKKKKNWGGNTHTQKKTHMCRACFLFLIQILR